MKIQARSYLTSGIAALGVGAIPLTPIQPLPEHFSAAPQRAVESMAVNLAAVIDPFTPIIDTIKTSEANLKILTNYWLENPFPIASTMLANQGTYLKELMNGQGNLIPGQIWNNVKTFFSAPFDPGTTIESEQLDPLATGQFISETVAVPITPTTWVDKKSAYIVALQYFLGEGDFETLNSIAPILNAVNTHVSSFAFGVIGATVAQFLQLQESFDAIKAAIKAYDFVNAFNEFINIPTKMTNAFLNGGQFLDLTDLVNKIKPLPPEITKIGIQLGGLLNLVPQNGSIKPDQPPLPSVYGGGVGFDGTVLQAKLGDLEGTIPGLPIGLTGSSLGLARYTAQQMLVTAPLKSAAAVAPAAAAAIPAEPASPAVPAVDQAPAVPAVPATPAVPAVPNLPEDVETPSALADDAPADAPAPTRGTRGSGSNAGGGNGNAGGGSSTGGHGHRGAA